VQAVRSSTARALTAALGCALALGGCGGSGSVDQSNERFSQPQVQRLTCADWQRFDIRERAEVIASLRETLGGEVVGRGASGKGSVLTDEQAQRLFNGWCKARFARGFSLYKLYGQAAGFAGRPRTDG
jgi:hypothetical protein